MVGESYTRRYNLAYEISKYDRAGYAQRSSKETYG